MSKKHSLQLETIRLILVPAILAAIAGFFLSNNTTTQPVHAFSSGPPPGYTGAPLEEPEACAECHVPNDAGTGQISITAPSTYVPGQTYSITVRHNNADPTRLRWGFELTVLDTSDEKAGNLTSLDGTTQVLNNAGPGGARQYIEHTANGTFIGQQNTASWSFNWTAPATDVGFVTFYAAGNQANNDGNTSGDYVYKTFVAVAPASTTPDFSVSVSPSSRTVVPGGSGQYTVTVTPLAGFTGVVNLSANNLPAGGGASFNPTSININDASSKTSTLTVTTTTGTPIASHIFDITSQSGSLMHSDQATLRVVSAASVDLAVTKTASPNPGQVAVNLSYRITVTNEGPASATNVILTDTLPTAVTFGSATTTQGSCNGTGPVNCSLGTIAVGSNVVVTINVTPNAQGQITNTATASATETDSETSNNTANVTTQIRPASPRAPTLISRVDDTRAVAFESVTMKAEPFPLNATVPFAADTRTRICIFAMDVELLAGDGVNAFTADAEDSTGRVYPFRVEYMGAVPNLPGITMFIVRLSDDIGDVGDVLLRLNLYGMGSNRVRVAIGHTGGVGPADDAGAVATPGPQTPPPAPPPLDPNSIISGPISDAGAVRFLEQTTWGPRWGSPAVVGVAMTAIFDTFGVVHAFRD